MSADQKKPVECPDCVEGTGSPVSRREFVKSVGTVALAGGLLGKVAAPARAGSLLQDVKRPAETAVKRLYDSLTEKQKETVCFGFEHDLRRKINANWAITKPTVEDFFTADQQKTIEEIFRGVTSEDGFERFQTQMDDDYGGLGSYHVAIFGKPGAEKFEFELTGRHLTLRADGDSIEGTAFGGPIVYGHGAGDGQKGLPGNVFYYQTLKANEVFQALDGKQRERALQPKAPNEAAVQVQGDSGKFPGISVGDLSGDQKELVESVLKVVLAPYRKSDVDEAFDLLKQGGGLDKLHMAFYQNQDLGNDQVWDIWRVEGPTFVTHFRGAPHVHAYINVAKKA